MFPITGFKRSNKSFCLFSGSPSNGNLDPPPAMLSLHQFQRWTFFTPLTLSPWPRLDSEAKYAEIGRLLPLVSGVAADFSLTQQTIGITLEQYHGQLWSYPGCAWRKLENLEMHMERSHKPEAFKEVFSHKTWRFILINILLGSGAWHAKIPQGKSSRIW